MTNEELAIQIQLGASDLYAELWEQVKKLMTKILFKELSTYTLPNYINQEDMVQEIYFALCKAVQAYDDTKPYKFTSYLTYSIKSVIQSKFRKKTFSETSYNITVDEDEETELLDFIADNTKANDFQKVELSDLQREVRQAVARLPEDTAEVIDLHFLQGVSYKSIANQKGCSQPLIAEKGRKGLQLLRQDKSLRLSYVDMRQHQRGKDWLIESAERMWKYSPEYLTAKAQLDERRTNGEYISYGTEQTLLVAQRTRYIESYIRERQSNSVYA